MQPLVTSQHDRSPLPMRMLVESGAAFVTALSIAPAVAIVDKAIVSNASGRQAMLPCVGSELKVLMSSPLQFLKQPNFLLILGVYRFRRIIFTHVCTPTFVTFAVQWNLYCSQLHPGIL
jgi:hypothetical protein